jgi:hypothetical protein|tara:strand:+ start:345 stop:533 length:189 start_codon:yes stop_codon:yes gene_type:complete
MSWQDKIKKQDWDISKLIRTVELVREVAKKYYKEKEIGEANVMMIPLVDDVIQFLREQEKLQ